MRTRQSAERARLRSSARAGCEDGDGAPGGRGGYWRRNRGRMPAVLAEKSFIM